MEMQKNLERIIAETSAVAIPVTAQPGEKEDWIRYSDSNEGAPLGKGTRCGRTH